MREELRERVDNCFDSLFGLFAVLGSGKVTDERGENAIDEILDLLGGEGIPQPPKGSKCLSTCSNGWDTYHDWNYRENGVCTDCGLGTEEKQSRSIRRECVEEIAEQLHNEYERLVSIEGWNTQEQCKERKLLGVVEAIQRADTDRKYNDEYLQGHADGYWEEEILEHFSEIKGGNGRSILAIKEIKGFYDYVASLLRAKDALLAEAVEELKNKYLAGKGDE